MLLIFNIYLNFIFFEGQIVQHYDVHRFHPPLIYGRRGGPDDGEGIALCRFKPNNVSNAGEDYQYLLITYLLPVLSAKAVP